MFLEAVKPQRGAPRNRFIVILCYYSHQRDIGIDCCWDAAAFSLCCALLSGPRTSLPCSGLQRLVPWWKLLASLNWRRITATIFSLRKLTSITLKWYSSLSSYPLTLIFLHDTPAKSHLLLQERWRHLHRHRGNALLHIFPILRCRKKAKIPLWLNKIVLITSPQIFNILVAFEMQRNWNDQRTL